MGSTEEDEGRKEGQEETEGAAEEEAEEVEACALAFGLRAAAAWILASRFMFCHSGSLSGSSSDPAPGACRPGTWRKRIRITKRSISQTDHHTQLD